MNKINYKTINIVNNLMLTKILEKIKNAFTSIYIYIILIFVAIAILIFIVVNKYCCAGISGEAFLMYAGSILASLATLLTAIVAIRNSEKINDVNDNIRKMNVAPELQVTIKKEKHFYTIIINNCSDYIVRTIYLHDAMITPYIKRQGKATRKFVIDACNDFNLLNLPAESFSINDKNEIVSFDLLFEDVDGRVIKQEFLRVEGDCFLSNKNHTEYFE